jgi:hypothetical protein
MLNLQVVEFNSIIVIKRYTVSVTKRESLQLFSEKRYTLLLRFTSVP